ncbi:MarR family transcriptional regulator [Kocuria sp. cx-455]|uniref:MarR family winged helix-turn-helix transcriptional regulator n=1 Tax=Kocuria sp. cx-455 TaxID=2771377 RepID=UPI001685BDC0|nr:MarR family transcriptional regulator [Kocuria sp. cx-455]MBD2763616.1 MarR family transcriptional regulator [Kocuria sp. cx-455]
MTASTSPLDLDNQLCFALYRASHAVVRAYKTELDRLGLTYPQYLAMLALWQTDHPLGVGQLGDLLGLDSGTLTPVLRRLEQRGLVVRRRDEHDERRRLIGLTDAGRDLRALAQKVPETIAARFPVQGQDYHLLMAQLAAIAQAFGNDR